MNSWQDWLKTNYDILSYWSKNWHRDEWRELIAHLTLYLEKNWPKFSQIPDGDERIKFCQTWMKNNVKWRNSDFNKSIETNNLSEDFNFDVLEIYEEHYDVISEDLSDDVKEFIIDLTRRFSEMEVRQIIKVRHIYLKLPPHERVLYDLYITQMMSLRQVAKKLHLPLSAVHNMVTDLKNKIKREC